jgi:L-tyrosine isonitrile desaturase/decarboxylase
MKFKETKLQPFGLLLEANRPTDDVRDLDVGDLRERMGDARIIVLRGFRTFVGAEDFAGFCERLGEISVWPFGKVLELVEQEKPEDHIFDHSYVPLHWDGMYRPQVPEFQVFHCVNAPGKADGGRTTFSDTTRALALASAATRAMWGAATGVYRREMEFYRSETIAPIVDRHPTRGFEVIRYCEPPIAGDKDFINHPDLEFRGLGDAAGAAELQRTLRQALYAPEAFYAHSWQEGDVVITDNHALLHGREAFTSGASRHLRRVHVLGRPPLDNPHLVSHA